MPPTQLPTQPPTVPLTQPPSVPPTQPPSVPPTQPPATSNPSGMCIVLTEEFIHYSIFPAGCMLHVWPPGPKITLNFLRRYISCLCVPTYHMCNNYATYIVAMLLYFS